MAELLHQLQQADRTWAEWIAWQLERPATASSFRRGISGPAATSFSRCNRPPPATYHRRSLAAAVSARFTNRNGRRVVQDPTGEKGLLLPVRCGV
jgi:hypothetical protein